MNNNNNNNKIKMNNNKPSDKPLVINHYHYNKNDNRNRKNNRPRNNNRGRKIPNVTSNVTSNVNPNVNSNVNPIVNPQPKSHLIIRSTENPSNIRIIPFTQSLNDPFVMNPNIFKSLFKNPIDKQEKQETDMPDLKLNMNEELVELNNINNLDDLIELGDKYSIEDKRRYPIDMSKLKNIVGSLKELRDVIGMGSVKKNIYEQLVYILQDLNDVNMMHTVIEGPPGVGKTLLGKIIAKIYYKLNFLKKPEKNEDELNDITNHLMAVLNPSMSPLATSKFNSKKKSEEEFKFKVVKRSDLIGQYVGSTAIKTQKVIDEAEGGVLFIDEVYSLGSGSNGEKTDSFAKECIDTLNQNLSENGDKFICIIAGYANEIDRCFFAQNEGLKRRFPFKYSIEKYDNKELAKIFQYKVKQIKWNLDESLQIEQIENFIEKNKKYFENFGGDIENLLLNIKIKHSLRVFGKDPKIRKFINMDDITSAFESFKGNKKEKELPEYVKNMYA